MCVTGKVLYQQGYKVTDIGNMSSMGVFVSIKGLNESDEFEINHV